MALVGWLVTRIETTRAAASVLARATGTRCTATLLLALPAVACGPGERTPGTGDDGIGSGFSAGDDGGGAGDDASDDSSPDDGGSPLLDMPTSGGDGGGDPGCGEGQLCGECEIPPHLPCDAAADTPLIRALGLNCPDEPQYQLETTGSAQALGKRSSFGNLGAFPPQEGSQYLVLGSGPVANLGNVNSNCDVDLGAFDPQTLPAPLVGADVGAETCTENPELIGSGDCSNTVAAQLSGTVQDYTSITITANVPDTVNSFSYDLAFFSIEYPIYYQSIYNDMYIGWLESEAWTGNISFDEAGQPISLNAGFLDYRDANAVTDPQCTGQCSAPELHGTCMQGHAGTKWLTTTAAVVPGEEITLELAIFDQSDSRLDSYVFLDNFRWGCEGDQPPQTEPVG